MIRISPQPSPSFIQNIPPHPSATRPLNQCPDLHISCKFSLSYCSYVKDFPFFPLPAMLGRGRILRNSSLREPARYRSSRGSHFFSAPCYLMRYKLIKNVLGDDELNKLLSLRPLPR
ncbi:hypothetical protein AVEN_254076-1 [Araneus ventricosus]|uniref:Uncharacterized protein n=1 Tax=Araneus ventricosus TaxID=182803 RepID=A0A4Y2BXQ5_ARAVE|nr:hypothetical protein AVEN_254076-1 [Araneus ventricosus]